MAKYAKYARPAYKRPWNVHPVWRGIGCLLAIIVPIMAYAGAVELVKYGLGHGWPIPPELLGRVHFPEWVWKYTFVANIAAPIASYNNLLAVLVFFLGLLLAATAAVTTLYAFIYRLAGPARYTPVDAPPRASKTKTYKR